MNVSKINFTSRKELDVPSWVNRTPEEKRIYQNRINNQDEFVTSKSRKKQKTTNLAMLKLLTALAVLGITSCSIKVNTGNSNKEIPLETIVETTQSVPLPTFEIPVQIDETEASLPVYDEMQEKAQNLLDEIKIADEYSDIRLEKMQEALGMDSIDVAKLLIEMCESPIWGNGCIEPLLFYAQIAQESNCEFDKLGDYNKKTGIYDALGYGQFHKCAVDEVNNQIECGRYEDYLYNDGEKYTYEDRKDPKKALEMMSLYLRYIDDRTNSTDAMLAMYNGGSKNFIKTSKGQEYVRNIYKQIDGE